VDVGPRSGEPFGVKSHALSSQAANAVNITGESTALSSHW